MSVVDIARRLRPRLERLAFAEPVTHVYNPVDYAWEPHRRYLERYLAGRPEALLLGLNPGPWGMAQSGVPFGDVTMVRDWLGIEGRVDKPRREHPKREVLGFACPRGEVSGRRLWGWARERFGSADRFRRRLAVLNYCPLCFLEESGRNRTPDHLPRDQRRPLFDLCDEALRSVVEILRPRVVIGVGRVAEGRARETLGDLPVEIGGVTHPSPANPAANRDWPARMDAALATVGIEP
jgi:single-strand selective monofunctional uracil DNA glycosylase